MVLRQAALLLGTWFLLLVLTGDGVALAAHAADGAPRNAEAASLSTPPAGEDGQSVHDAAGNPIPPLTPQPLPTAEQAIRFQICTARIQPGDSPESRITSLKGFDCTTRPAELHAGSYWLRLRPQDPTQRLETQPSGLTILSFVPGWQQNGAIYVHHTDGTIKWMALDNRALSHETHIGARVQLRLNTRGPRPDAILLRIDHGVNNNGLIGTPTLRSEMSSNRDELLETAIYSTFAGLCLALLVFNLALLGSMREGFQVTYCLMVIGMLIYAWSQSGGWSLWFPDRDITECFRLGYVARGLTAALGLRFFIDFLEPGVLPRWLRMIATTLRLALLAITAAIVVVPLPLAQTGEYIYASIFALEQMAWVLVGLVTVLRGSRAALLLSPTWLMLLLGGWIRLAYFRGTSGPDVLASHTVLVTFAMTALLYALAIAMRVKMLAEERDHARNEERMARRLADMDPLTGLLNRRGLLAQVNGDGQHGTLRLLIVDVDHFKAINDGHGHDRGDDVLRDLALVLGRRVGRRGRVARLGGEEFAVIGTAGELSPALALAILADVRHYRFPGGIAVTVSIGMAEGQIAPGQQGEADWSKLYRRADMALYEAKTTGRNRVVDAALMEAGLGSLGTLPPASSHREEQRATG
jgi:diguanylate cyclase (GGDEF)-like protein